MTLTALIAKTRPVSYTPLDKTRAYIRDKENIYSVSSCTMKLDAANCLARLTRNDIITPRVHGTKRVVLNIRVLSDIRANV